MNLSTDRSIAVYIMKPIICGTAPESIRSCANVANMSPPYDDLYRKTFPVLICSKTVQALDGFICFAPISERGIILSAGSIVY